jgi:hypothetical protein
MLIEEQLTEKIIGAAINVTKLTDGIRRIVL